MFPLFTSSQSLFRNAYRHARRPSRLTLGVAATTAVAVAGLATAVSAGTSAGAAAPSPRAFSHSAAISHAGAYRAAGHAGTSLAAHAAGPRQSRRPAVRIQLASREHPRKQAAGLHPAHQAPARHAAVPARHAAVPARHPYLIYDSVTPSAIPAHHAVATYATGNYAVSPAQVAGRKTVLWVDTTGTYYKAAVLDVEPGDATPSQAANWVRHKLTAQPNALARVYTMRSEWPAVQAAIGALPSWMHSHVRWWIADPTGYPHIVPGSNATQWYWGSNYDITTATPRF